MTGGRRACAAALLAAALLAAAGCGSDTSAGHDAATGAGADAAPDADAPPDAAAGRPIVAGERIGPVALGQSWADVHAALGDPDAEPVVLTRIGFARWPALGIEVLFTSPDEATLAPDALVIGAAATAPADFAGSARPGLTRAAIEAELGAAPEEYGGRAFYPVGLVIQYDGDVAAKVAVVAAYQLVPEPPPMAPAQTTIPGATP